MRYTSAMPGSRLSSDQATALSGQGSGLDSNCVGTYEIVVKQQQATSNKKIMTVVYQPNFGDISSLQILGRSTMLKSEFWQDSCVAILGPWSGPSLSTLPKSFHT